MITFIIAFTILLIVGSVFHQDTADDLEAAKTELDNIFNTNIPSQVKVYTTRKSHKLMISLTLFVAVLCFGSIVYIGSDWIFEDIFYYGVIESFSLGILSLISFLACLSAR